MRQSQGIVDNEEVPHFRVNYVLRAIVLPAGEHNIRFEFNPPMFKIGGKVALGSSIILLVLIVFALFSELKNYIVAKPIAENE